MLQFLISTEPCTINDTEIYHNFLGYNFNIFDLKPNSLIEFHISFYLEQLHVSNAEYNIVQFLDLSLDNIFQQRYVTTGSHLRISVYEKQNNDYHYSFQRYRDLPVFGQGRVRFSIYVVSNGSSTTIHETLGGSDNTIHWKGTDPPRKLDMIKQNLNAVLFDTIVYKKTFTDHLHVLDGVATGEQVLRTVEERSCSFHIYCV
jgi:hypothetical protein